jgi:hypothetical protein
MTFLVSDGLYFREGLFTDLLFDRYTGPVIIAARELLDSAVDVALAKGV